MVHVGVAMLSVFVGPVWHFLDPFSTLHDIGAWVLRRLGIQPWERHLNRETLFVLKHVACRIP